MKITWVVYDQTPDGGATFRIQREAVVRIGANVRRFPLDVTTATCGGNSNDRHTPENPVPIGGLVAMLSCYSGGADDVEAWRVARGTIELRSVLQTDGYDPDSSGPLASTRLATFDVPEDAVFSEAIVSFDHGKQIADPALDP